MVLGFTSVWRFSMKMRVEANNLERKLLIAQDLYEEMRSVPFDQGPVSSQESNQTTVFLTRPIKAQSIFGYDNFENSPPTDVANRKVPWGEGLTRKVTVRRFTPQDRANVLPPLKAPEGEYAEIKLKTTSNKPEEAALTFRSTFSSEARVN